MIKKLKAFCLILITALLPISLVGCSDSKTLKKDQYQIYNQGSSFTIRVTDTDINAENIETVKVKIKYKYTVAEYKGGSTYATGFKTKTKTETFEVEKFSNVSGNFSGGFNTTNPVSEFECKKVVAYYDSEDDDPNDEYISIPAAIGLAIGIFVVGLVIWFLLPFGIAYGVVGTIYGIFFIGMLITGQWIQALIFIISAALFAGLGEVVFRNLFD